jgi:phosphatidylinositol 4-kinase
MTQSMSLLGFLDAVAQYAIFWNAYERLQMVEDIRAALSEKFLIAFETALSIVRNARSHQHGLREWRRYTKHYAATGRPLGAMILHESFLNVAVACAALLVQDPVTNSDVSVLDHLQSSFRSNQLARATSEDGLAEGLTIIALEEMERLDNDLDYLQRVGSAWQQHQGSAVKAKILTTYLCCTAYDEDIADADTLLTWLDTALNDPAQTADFTLASTVLRCMATLAKLDSAMASTLGRTLPRVIVQANFDQRTSDVAADCLASVLSLLPQDAIITTLYSLGNVISAAPLPDRSATASPSMNGGGKVSRNTMYDQQATGSAISLTPSNVEEPHHVHKMVVQAVVCVARNCKDEKITALALSMLVQKVGRASRAVDVKIIADCALLGVYSGPGEFRSLLKLYSKLCHDALIKGDTATLEAVSSVPDATSFASD